jgi:hypothetical protein
LKTKFAIGCLVQWYEIEMVEEYFDSVAHALYQARNSYDITVDVCFNMSQGLEKIDSAQAIQMQSLKPGIQPLDAIKHKFLYYIKFLSQYSWIKHRFYEEDAPYTIADYRREFNDKYCEQVDILMWGESDSLIPRHTFEVLDNIHNNVKEKTPKYIAFFSTCKMWDDSWKVLEHPEFTDKPFYDSPEEFNPDKHWWSLRYTMSIEEMDNLKKEEKELDVVPLSQYKFNGCGLVISSEVIKSGVNIPRSVFFVHEDTSFMIMIQKVLGTIPQFVIKNMLLVHNRNHPKKRMYVEGESGNTMNEKRRSNDWYVKANKMSELNCYNIANPDYKSYTWEDVWK